MDENSIVSRPSVSQETGLVGTNPSGKERLDSIHNYLGEKLVNFVTKPNRSEIPQSLSIVNFKNKAEQSSVGFGGK